MNWFQRFCIRLAAKIAPPLGRVLVGAGGAIEKLEEQVTLYREELRDRSEQTRGVIGELMEAAAMAGPGPWAASPDGMRARESSATIAAKESIAELELALEDRGWRRITAMSEIEFSRWGIQQIILICRLFRIKNPLIQRGILVSSYYVFGRGFEVSSEDETANAVLKDFYHDPRNRAALGTQALMEHEATLYTDGNIFWAFFTAIDDGRCVVRTIDAIEIQEIVTDPDDSAVPRFYRRRWSQKNFDERSGVTSMEMKEGWYTALGYEGTIPAQINGKEVQRDASGEPIRVYHRKDGGLPKWHFGCPRAYAAIDWARAYKARLEDYATIVRNLSRFALDVETKGGVPAIAALKQTLATTLANDGTSLEQNPPPTVGSAWISGPGNKVKAFDAAGKTPPPEEGRRLAHMVYMVFGLPETFFSDVSVGTLATATSLDRPTELKFLMHQEGWREDIEVISRYVLQMSDEAPAGRMREARTERKARTIDVQVKFPPILEGDIPAEVASVVQAMTLGSNEVIGIDERTGVKELLRLIGVDDVETVLAAMYPEGSYDPDRTLEPDEPEATEPPVAPREVLVLKAIKELKAAQAKHNGVHA